MVIEHFTNLFDGLPKIIQASHAVLVSVTQLKRFLLRFSQASSFEMLPSV